ncbi:MAG TPA: hypothetical protein VGR52_08340 [Stellaceae bacterium]|nr:hypothetical protein [Stellaceae bacterium]
MNWADLYALVATGCGYTWPEIDAMSLSALRDLLAYWSRHPPAHLLLAAALRVTPRPRPDRATFADLAALAPNGVLARRDSEISNSQR